MSPGRISRPHLQRFLSADLADRGEIIEKADRVVAARAAAKAGRRQCHRATLFRRQQIVALEYPEAPAIDVLLAGLVFADLLKARVFRRIDLDLAFHERHGVVQAHGIADDLLHPGLVR